jgi:hypothetical protein
VGEAAKDRGKIWISCPHCGFKTEKTLAWTKDHSAFDCSICSKVVTVQPEALSFKTPDDQGWRVGKGFLARTLRLG